MVYTYRLHTEVKNTTLYTLPKAEGSDVCNSNKPRYARTQLVPWLKNNMNTMLVITVAVKNTLTLVIRQDDKRFINLI